MRNVFNNGTLVIEVVVVPHMKTVGWVQGGQHYFLRFEEGLEGTLPDLLIEKVRNEPHFSWDVASGLLQALGNWLK
jgi:hypothetical protein